jgi:hypothetical protein
MSRKTITLELTDAQETVLRQTSRAVGLHKLVLKQERLVATLDKWRS